MSRLRYSTSMSLDGFVAGPRQGIDNPLGVGGERLHAWMRELELWRREAGLTGGVVNESTKVIEEEDRGIAAIIMGRNMFGGGPGPWREPLWNGWWGSNPPFHLPVFVLTHHARPIMECDGGTTFNFVSDGIESAKALALEAAQGDDVAISGGAGMAKQYLAAGLIDEIIIHLVPTLLGDGVRLFDDPHGSVTNFTQASVTEAPGVTHLKYELAH